MTRRDDCRPFVPLGMAVLTVSDSRSQDEDRSGDLLCERVASAGHRLIERALVCDERVEIVAVLHRWIADPRVSVVVSTGGTGLTGRDVTPEAVEQVIDKTIPGFGELFRQISFEQIGPATIQSRALGGMADTTLIFALPGSTGACRDAWDRILGPQLDNRSQPCNFVELMPRFGDDDPGA